MVDASTGIISTIAGTYPNGGTTADGEPAVGAKLTGPYYLEYRASEYALYIGGFGDNNIRRVQLSSSPTPSPTPSPSPSPSPSPTPSLPAANTITTVAGSQAGTCGTSGVGGPASALLLCQPNGVIFDPSGNMYISDAFDKSDTARILRVDAITGIVSTIAASPALSYVGQMVYSASGAIFLVNFQGTLGASVVKLAAGSFTPSVFASGSFDHPNGLAADASGNLYASDGNTHKLYKIDTSGALTVFAGTGVAGFSGDGGPASLAQLNFPMQLAFNSAGDLFICDCSTQSVRKINMVTFVISTVAGVNGAAPGYSGDGGLAILANLKYPYGLAFDASDNM